MSGEDVEALITMAMFLVVLAVPLLVVLYRRDQRAKADRILDLLNNKRRR